MDKSKSATNFIRKNLNISKDYKKIFSFVDFANVNKWFENDNQDWNNRLLADNKKLSIDLEKLKKFADVFSERTLIYYGEDSQNIKSLNFTYMIRKIFKKNNVVIKDLQRIKHYLEINKINAENNLDKKYKKNYLKIRKCNFDVEISVDAIRMMKHYDAFCIFSGDADFTYLNNFLKKKEKKIIIIKGGYITTKLKESADLIISAQEIKE